MLAPRTRARTTGCPSPRRLVFVRPLSTRMTDRSTIRLLSILALLGASACASDSRAARVPARDVERVAPSASSSGRRRTPPRSSSSRATRRARRATPKPRLLTEDEQRVADGIAFAPSPIERFFVAARNKRLLVDVGRVDLETKQDARQLALVRRVRRVSVRSRASRTCASAADGARRSTRSSGTTCGTGASSPCSRPARRPTRCSRKARRSWRRDARAASADSSVAPQARRRRAAAPAAVPACATVFRPSCRRARPTVRDSVVRWVTDSLKPPYATSGKLAVRGDAAADASDRWRFVVVVTTRTPAFEWSEERTLLVAPDGKSIAGAAARSASSQRTSRSSRSTPTAMASTSSRLAASLLEWARRAC